MRLIIIVLLSLGICFRFVNLDHKVYWYDETFTSLRSSGYTEAEVVEYFGQNSIASVADLQRYQQPDPQRGVRQTWHSLAIEDPQHPPLYYILVSYWVRWVGHSVAAMRLLPALLSLLALPCAYWLCQELFAAAGTIPVQSIDATDKFLKELLSSRSAIQNLKSKIQNGITGQVGMGGMAIGLIAVSPFHVLYAQEAREYSLWSVTALLATATLLRALRVNTAASWLIYALSLAASLYTFLFSIWIAVAHAIYVLVLSKFRLNPTIAAYLLATLLTLAAFSPWLWITLQNLTQIQTVTDWTANPRSLLSLTTSWASMLGRLFYDRGVTAIDRTVQVSFILLVGAAFYTLCRHTSRAVWLLLVALTLVPFLVLILPDLIWGGGRSTSPRYLIPALCSIQLTVAYGLAARTATFPLFRLPCIHKSFLPPKPPKVGGGLPSWRLPSLRVLQSPTQLGDVGGKSVSADRGKAWAFTVAVFREGKAQQKWQWITAAVFTAGILSNLTIASAQTWWIKPYNQENPAVAQVINRAVQPLLISDAETADLLSLSYFLDAETDLLIRPRCYTCSIASPKQIDPAILEIPPDYRSIFLFHPRATKEWRQSLNSIQNYHLEAALPQTTDTLWQLTAIDRVNINEQAGD